MTDLQLFPLIDRHADEIVVIRSDGGLSVDQLISEATAVANRLAEHQYVINLYADRYDFLLGFCAAIIAGQCTLMPPNRQPRTIEQLFQTYPDCHVIGESDGVAPRQTVAESKIEIPKIPADQLCAIAFTSGSTGSPKANMKYWETLRTGSISNGRLLLGDFNERANLLATVPSQHMWGLETAILLPMFANAAVTHLTPFYPQDIADALQTLPEPRVLISSPIHLETLLKSGVQFPTLSKIFTATAPLSKELAVQLEASFDAPVLDVFGCTEAGILAVRSTSSETLWEQSGLFEFAATNDGMRIRAQHLPEDVQLPGNVELIDENHFRWVGSHQDMINIAGKRGSLADLNHRLREIPGVEDGVIFQLENNQNRLAALVVAPDLTVADILSQLRNQLDPLFIPRPVYRVTDLPRQETGKMPIKAVEELFKKTQKEIQQGN